MKSKIRQKIIQNIKETKNKLKSSWIPLLESKIEEKIIENIA